MNASRPLVRDCALHLTVAVRLIGRHQFTNTTPRPPPTTSGTSGSNWTSARCIGSTSLLPFGLQVKAGPLANESPRQPWPSALLAFRAGNPQIHISPND